VEENVGVAVDVEAAEVNVRVSVKLGRISNSPVEVGAGGDVGVKKSRANASRVKDRSMGVVVAVLLGIRTTSSCVSSLPPAIKEGKRNARTHAPTNTNRTIVPCAFTLLVSFLSQTHNGNQVQSCRLGIDRCPLQ
jgi:hypothetical protein